MRIEYKVERKEAETSQKDLETFLTAHGEEGFELCAILHHPAPDKKDEKDEKDKPREPGARQKTQQASFIYKRLTHT